MRLLWAAIVGTAVVGTVITYGRSQSRQNPPPIMSPTPSANIPSIGRPDPTGTDPLNARMADQQVRSRNSDRQKRLVSDTDKLVTLSKQLKDDVQGSDKQLPPSDLQKRAEEIEKLAKSVKDRMRG